MAEEYLRPVSDVVVGWVRWGGTSNYGNIDDDTATPSYGSGESIHNSYAARTDQYGMSDAVSMGESDTATQIQVLVWASSNETSYHGDINTRIYINSGWIASTGSQTILDNYATHRWYTWTYSGSWTQAQINGMEVELTVTSNGGSNDDYVSCLRALVTYSEAALTALPRRALDGPFYGSLRGSVR